MTKFLRFLALFFVFLPLAVFANTTTLTHSAGGGNIVITVVYTGGTTADISFTYDGGGSPPVAIDAAIYKLSGDGGDTLGAIWTLPDLGSSGTGSTTKTVVAGSYFRIDTVLAGGVTALPSESRHKQGKFDATANKKVKISYFNSQDYVVSLKLVGDPSGTVLGQTAVPPHSGFIQEYTLPEGDDNALLFVQVAGVNYDGNHWVESPGHVHDIPAGTIPGSSSSPTPTSQVGQPVNMPAIPSPAPGPGPAPGPSPEPHPKPPEPVWKPDPAEPPGPDAQTDLLTNSVFREGVTNLSKAVGRVETVNNGIADDVKKIADQQDLAASGATVSGRASVKSLAEATIAASTAQLTANFNASWDTYNGDGVSPRGQVGGVIGSGSSAWPSFDFPLLGHVVFSPYEITWLVPAMNCARELILWLLITGFIVSCIDRVNKYEMALMTVPNADTTISIQDMVPVGGQLLSWLKTFVTASGAVIAMIAAYALAVGLINSHLVSIVSGSNILNWLNSSDVISSRIHDVPSPFWNFALEFFPLGAFISLIIAEAVVAFSMGKIFLLASGLVRLIRA